MTKKGIFIGALLALFPAIASAAYQMSLQPPVTRIAGEIYELHTLMMIIIVIVFLLVFSVMFYSIFKHRKSVVAKAEKFHQSTPVEIIWTVIPLVILVGIVWPATKTVLSL